MCFTFTNLLLFSLCVCFLFSEITCQVIVTFFGFVWVRIFLSHTFDLLTMSYTVYVAFYVYPTHSSYNSQWAETWKVSFWKKQNTDVVLTLFFLYLQIKRGGTQDCNHVWSVRITFKFQYTLAFAMWDSNLTKASPLHLFASLLQTLQAFGELISVVSNVSCQWDGLIDWIKTRQHTSYAFSTLTLSWMLTLMSEFSNLNIKK